MNVDRQLFQCFHPPCGQSGDVLSFWAAYHGLSLHDAALHLVDTFGLDPGEPPRRFTPRRPPRT